MEPKEARRQRILFRKVEAVMSSSRAAPGALPLTTQYIRNSILRPLEVVMGTRLGLGIWKEAQPNLIIVGQVSPEEVLKRNYEDAVRTGNYIEIL